MSYMNYIIYVKKADYKIYNPLTQEDMKNAIKYMNNLFDELKFQK